MIHISSGAPTLQTIRDGIVAAIGGGSKPVNTTSVGSFAYQLRRDLDVTEPARNTPIIYAVQGPGSTDMIRGPVILEQFWSQTGTMAIDP